MLFNDASFGNLPDGGSQGGYVVFLMGVDGKVNPITWHSKKLRRVVRSTLASEALALADGVDCVISLAALFKELMHNEHELKHTPVTCFVDNKDLYHAIYSDKPVGEKRLRVEINAIKQLLQGGELKEIKWIQTYEQIANVLTKHGASGQDILCCFEKGFKPFVIGVTDNKKKEKKDQIKTT
ncbi:unnamed protein product [Mytilus coruscus]|uniref:Reverse transcriptase RNase H-like domain-containing protein n=1 Tax=Mytilus coruscus TaxID=42192 RepID=A0A6J8D5P5_MYTCO|nr:unnamed protein product [Mytilus coruscus]